MHFQRFTVDNQGELREQIKKAEADLSEARERNEQDVVFGVAAALGSMLTTARREVEARSLLLASLEESRRGGTSESTGKLLLNLATANQYLDRRQEANAQFNEALEIAQSSGLQELEHFVLHHWGRSLVEEGETDRARILFTRALELRQKLNDPRQASTRNALEAIGAPHNERDA